MYNKLHFYNTPLNIDITNHRQKEIAIIIIHGGIKMFLSFVSGFYLYGSLCSPCFLIGSYFDIKKFVVNYSCIISGNRKAPDRRVLFILDPVNLQRCFNSNCRN